MVSARNRLGPHICAWENPPLPDLPDVYRGIDLREGARPRYLERVAETKASALRSPTMRSDRAASA